MANLLRNFDPLSFWLGFLAATLFWALIRRLGPLWSRLRAFVQVQTQKVQQERTHVDEVLLINDTLSAIERSHLAASLFSLDEILIPPRLLSPPLPPHAYEATPIPEEITDQAIPYTPDWPEMASFYKAPTLSLAEALQGGANLAVIGQAGSGKSVALAHLALQIIRKAPEAAPLAHHVPLLVHAADLLAVWDETTPPFECLLIALASSYPTPPIKRLPIIIEGLFRQERALLLVDGLDELPRSEFDRATEWLAALLRQFPSLRGVVTAHPSYLGKLPSLGFRPLALASWGAEERVALIHRWSDLWQRYFSAPNEEEAPANPLLISGWLATQRDTLTPLEITLQVWSALAGDSRGPGVMPSLEAYFLRLLNGQPSRHRLTLENLAGTAVLLQKPFFSPQEAEKWSSAEELHLPSYDEQEEVTITIEERGSKNALPDLLASGLLVKRGSGVLSFSHPLLAAYLAAPALARWDSAPLLLKQADWGLRAAVLSFLSAQTAEAWLEEFIQKDEDNPLHFELLQIARWIRLAPEQARWLSPALRHLASSLQNRTLPFSLRTRLTAALIDSGKSGMTLLFRQLLQSPYHDLRHLALLGLGMLRDAASVPQIIPLLQEVSSSLYCAAALALTAIGDKQGLEALAARLLDGNEHQRRAAAEALANHPEEGHPTLEDATHVADPLVRRAAVFGLLRTRQPWAIRLLEKLRQEDAQWLVQDAAAQALQILEGTPIRAPRPIPALEQTPWLIAFAAEREMGVAPGKAAYEMLYRALQQGTYEQKEAALYFLAERGDESAVEAVYSVYTTGDAELRQRAFETLLSLNNQGYSLKVSPSPQRSSVS